MQKPEEMHVGWRYTGSRWESDKGRRSHEACGLHFDCAGDIGFAVCTAAPEQCRFIEARSEREACYQRQETARAARQKALETQQAAQPKPYEPMAAEDAQLAKAIRGICRGC